jgi:lipoprotein-releasing system permease protein
VTGIGLGLLLNEGLKKYQWIHLPSEIYQLGFLPVLIRWNEILMIGIVTLLICFLGTLLPAWKVSRFDPMEGLRND